MPATNSWDIQVGDKVRLLHMGEDPDPIPVGTTGRVKMVTDISFMRPNKEVQLVIAWDNGRSLSCICPPDLVEVLEKNDEEGDSDEVD